MVQIIDPSFSESAYLLRDELRRRNIPCAVTDTMSDTALVTVRFTDSASPEVTESVLFSDRCALDDMLTRNTELARVASRVLDVLFMKYGINPESYSAGGVTDNSGDILYFGRRIYLTSTERLILCYLMSHGDTWCTAYEIGKYCLVSEGSSGAVPVHINKINRKSKLCSPIKMIETRRGSGYRLTIK